ncbi:hypothetical protein SADUNF_Sadunf05G0177000 [Salix dunnii]|uniref:Uncharacterized protein n=1 Tax=Salix dunnii TaxID=1413687 RepID=A0A835K4R6_9ROSI|nr:hypothetical protein SADUNF_Sadunf05G0177000 [Salix dunnii]
MKLVDVACHSSNIHGFKTPTSVLISFRLISLPGPALSRSRGHPLCVTKNDFDGPNWVGSYMLLLGGLRVGPDLGSAFIKFVYGF